MKKVDSSMDRHAARAARDDDKKVDSSVFVDCHDFASAKSRDDRESNNSKHAQRRKDF